MSPRPENSLDVSRPEVGIVASSNRFADETAALLQRRVRAVALILIAVLSAAFAGSLLTGATQLIVLRVLILSVVIGCFVLLSRRQGLSTLTLRIFEACVFAAIKLQIALMLGLRMLEYAGQGDSVSTVAAYYLGLGGWSVVLLIYGIFIPNDWKRAAWVLVPLSLLPYILITFLKFGSETVMTALQESAFVSPVPIPCVAALVGVYGAYVINTARRDEFKARQFGQYHLKEKLGAGGMGEVYKAEHRMLKRPCAIKLIRPESEADAKAIARFELEVQAMARLSHWNTVEVFDYGRTEDGVFYYVMELLPGLSLDEMVEGDRPLPPERAIHLLLQTCHALREAHGVGLIHRDIKPANIFVARRGGVRDVAKLLDFGLVKDTAPSEPSSGGAAGSFSGSPLYLAPEQVQAYEAADQRSDIYSLGCVAYFMLSGYPPFPGTDLRQILRDHAEKDPQPLDECGVSVPEDLEQVVRKCLSKAPADRYATVRELEADLRACASSGLWTEDMADAWWQEHDGKSRSENRIGEPIEMTVESIERTIRSAEVDL